MASGWPRGMRCVGVRSWLVAHTLSRSLKKKKHSPRTFTPCTGEGIPLCAAFGDCDSRVTNMAVLCVAKIPVVDPERQPADCHSEDEDGVAMEASPKLPPIP